MAARIEAVERFVQLPTDGERPVGGGRDVACVARLDVGAPAGAAGDALVLGALGALLHRYTQQTTLAIDVWLRGAPGGARRVAVDLPVAGDTPLAQVISQASAALEAAPGWTAPSNVAVTLVDPESSGAGALEPASAAGDYDLHLVRRADEISVTYDARLFAASSVQRLVDGLVAVSRAASSDASIALERLPMLGPAEVRALTLEQDSGTATYAPVPIHRLFEALAKVQPAAVAATSREGALRYGELEERSNRLAHYLVASGVGPEVPVGVCFRPSVDALVALMAIFKAGGIYLPLDPTHPEAFIARMLDEARPRVVLTHAALSGLTRPERFAQLRLDADWEMVAGLPATPLASEPSFDHAAYLLYTSGTTGKPKGVVATYKNLSHYIHAARDKYGFCASDVFSSIARHTFSISLFDLLSPLCCGGSVRILDRDDILAPERLAHALEEVTVMHAGPSLLGTLFRYLRTAGKRTFPKMRHASTGGDLVPPSIMEEMKQVFENAEVYVIYGCTEISCMGTTFPIPREAKVTRSFVGKPFPDVAVRVLDANRQLVPFGVVGEICFSGKGIVRGYLDRPELTAQKFVELDGRRFYQTGDMGRLHADGNLEILGRRDFQVQLRGIRVELGGIENTVRELGLAAQCVVVAKRVDEDDLRLVAYVVKPADANIASFRRALSAELPDYMLPQHVVVLDAMPVTPNGKLDRRRLQEMPLETQRDRAAGPAPQTRAEQKIADAFCRALGVRDVGLDDDFFDLGGHSLLAVVALREIELALGVTLSPYVLFERPTVRGLAAHVEGAGDAESRPILLNEVCAGPKLFLLSGIHVYFALAKRLQGRCTAYGVFARSEFGTLDSATVTYAVPELAREYVSMIRREQPKGPYRLLGYSFAGIVAYEVAQQLRAAGEEVRSLALVDAVLPEWMLGWRFRLAQLTRLPRANPRDLARFVVRRVRRTWEPPSAEFVRFADDPRAGPLERQRDAVNYRAAADYMAQMRPFVGNVTQIASGVRLRNDPLKSPTGGFGPYIPQLHVETLDADHFGILTDEPYVSQLAEVLLKRM